MNLLVERIIPKVYMDTQVLGAINKRESVTYIDASYAI